MRRLMIISALLIATVMAWSQEYKNAAGIRAGLTGGIEYRVYTDDLNSYRILLGSRDKGLILHVLKEFYKRDLFDFSDQLYLVYGVGVHTGYQRWDQQYFNYNSSYYVTRTAFIAGLDGLAGIEYLFREVPISLGFEAKPYFDLFGQQMFDFRIFDLAFTVRYHF